MGKILGSKDQAGEYTKDPLAHEEFVSKIGLPAGQPAKESIATAQARVKESAAKDQAGDL